MSGKNNSPLSPSQEFYLGLIEKEYTTSEEEDLASIPVTVDQLKIACVQRKCCVQLNNLNLYKKLENKIIKKFPDEISKYSAKKKEKVILNLFNKKTSTYYFPLYDKWESRREQNKSRKWRRNKIELLRYFEQNRSEKCSQPMSTISFTNEDAISSSQSESLTGSVPLFQYMTDSEDIFPPTQTQGYTNFDLELANRFTSDSQPTTSTQNFHTD